MKRFKPHLPFRHTSDVLEEMIDHHRSKDRVTVYDINLSLSERGFGVLLAIAALPLCLPVPVPPGYTTFFAIPLLLLAVQMIAGKEAPWIPLWLAKRTIKRELLANLIRKAGPMLRKIEKLTKHRLELLVMETGERIIGFFTFIFAISIAVPLPLTNLPPGYGILIMALGLLARDGYMVLTGMIVGIIGCIITAVIVIEGSQAVLRALGMS